MPHTSPSGLYPGSLRQQTGTTDIMRGTATPKGQPNKRLSREERQATVRKQRAVIAAVLAVILLYIGTAVYHAGHFLKKTTINGVDVSGMTAGQAVTALQAAVSDYRLTVKGPEGKTEEISGDGLDLQVTDSAGAREYLKKQGAFLWMAGSIRQKSYTTDLQVACNEAVLDERIASLEMLNEENMREPVNAKISVMNDGTCRIDPEKAGTEIDKEAAVAAIRDAVKSGRRELDLDPFVTKPTVLAQDEGLIARADAWNNYLKAAGLTYRVCGHDITLDGSRIASLLKDDGTEVTVSKSEVANLVASWKSQYDTYSRRFELKTYDGTTETIDPNGDYGYELNDEEAVEDIIKRIENGDSGSYELTYWHKPLFDTNNGLGGTYVEINLRQQHMWVWKDGEVVVDTDIVSGLPVWGRVTYMGCFAIKKKENEVTLGDVEVEGYSQVVKYWAPFNGGEGLHDAWWRENFGGDIWLYAGSHGCINVPAEVMPDVFANVEVGEAVVIYGDPYDESVYTKESS